MATCQQSPVRRIGTSTCGAPSATSSTSVTALACWLHSEKLTPVGGGEPPGVPPTGDGPSGSGEPHSLPRVSC